MKIIRRYPLMAWLFLLAIVQPSLAQAERYQLIQQRGAIIVGVKTDYPPFGMLNAQGEKTGFEHDLALDVARQLQVGLRTVGVTGANRLVQLNDGRIDVVIATMGDTAARREIANLIEPDYYASGAAIMARADTRLKKWSDLRGQTVCATQGAYFNRPLSTGYQVRLQLYGNVRDAKLAVRDGRCIGWIFDNTAIAGDLQREEWRDYTMPLPPQWVTPWAIAIARSERGSELEFALSDIVANWHRSGFLIALEKKWHLPASRFLQQQHQLWTQRDASGAFVCQRNRAGGWPAECRNPGFIASHDVSGLARAGLHIKERTGLDFVFVYDPYERRQFALGIATTLGLTIGCVVLSLLVGIGLAFLAQTTPFLYVGALAQCWRMTPPLLQMYILLFGVGTMIYQHCQIRFEPVAVVIICLSCYTGASIMHMLQTALGTLSQVANPERADAAATPLKLTRHSLGRVLAHCFTPVSAALINVSKATMMAGVFSVPDLLSVATAQIAERGNTGTVMATVMLIYIAIVYAMTAIFHALGRRLQGS